MKWGILLVAVGAAIWFGLQHRQKRSGPVAGGGAGLAAERWTQQRAEEALLASVCTQELNAQVLEHFVATQQAMKEGKPLAGAALAFDRKALYEGSSLAPHLATFERMGGPSIEHVKELAKVAAARCPDVFPEPIKAEKPLAYVWMMARSQPE